MTVSGSPLMVRTEAHHPTRPAAEHFTRHLVVVAVADQVLTITVRTPDMEFVCESVCRLDEVPAPLLLALAAIMGVDRAVVLQVAA